jgi:hypothetical protein
MSSYQDRRSLMHGNSLGSLTTSGANETAKDIAPSGISIPLLQAKILTGNYAPAEVWVPVGLWYIITTGITVTAAVVTLRKNGVSAASGGTATLPIAASGADWKFAAFSSYTFAAADAAADQWSVLVTTTSTAGVVNPVVLAYAIRAIPNVTEGSL